MFPMQVPARILSPRDAILPLLLAATLLIPTSGSVTANAATLALGKQVSDTLQLGRSGVAIVLPEGDWRVSGLVRPRQIGAPYALAVLTRSEGQALTGTVWIRAVGEARFETSAMWCSDGGCASTSSPLSAKVAWAVGGSGVGPPRSQARSFSLTGGRRSAACGERGVPLPRALIAVGYHLVGAGRTLTVEYSFDASQVTVDDVKQWGRAWQDHVRAAFADSSPPSPPRLP